ncbi:cation:proton antiporter [soil metagenome]
MILLFDLTLPFKDPVLIFCLVLLIILLTPILLAKIKFPSIIGLILAGVLIGPHGFNLLLRDASIELFGTVGLLYIMFIAGLEIDLADFKLNKNKSIVFGAFTFIIPMILGTIAGYYVLNFSLASSILLASMFASHTLLAYPITSGYGINKLESINITVGGTIITDTAALLVLAVIAGSAQGDLNVNFWIQLIISILIFGFIVLYLIPIVCRWFFKKMEGQGEAQFIFSLSVVFGSAFLAELAGVEAIIGAFLSGLALNRFIPHTSPLMNRIEFVGNTLFIPFFMIGVGMLVYIRVLVQGTKALFVAVIMIIIAISAKWIAAFVTQKFYKYSNTERNVIFGLSSAQAAATLAVVLVGYNLEFFDVNVLNGTVIMILVTCLTSSFFTENAAKKLAQLEKEKTPEFKEIDQRILVPIANPENMENLIDLAVMIKDPDSKEPIYPLSVVQDDQEATEKLLINKKIIEGAVKHGAASENSIRLVSRIDQDISKGILRCIREMLITEIIVGWDGKVNSNGKAYGHVLDTLLEETSQMIWVSKIINPVNTIKKIVLAIPPLAEEEEGFEHWISKIKNFSKEIGAEIHVYSNRETEEKINEVIENSKPAVDCLYFTFEDWDDFLVLSRELEPDDLFIIISARHNMKSYRNNLDKIPGQLSRYFSENNYIIVFPALEDNDIKVAGKTATKTTKEANPAALENLTGGVNK